MCRLTQQYLFKTGVPKRSEGNRGIDLAIAQAFAKLRPKVAAVGRDTEALEQARADIAGRRVKVQAITADLFTADGCAAVINETVNAFGGLDVLVCNASTSIGGTFESLSDNQALERVMGKTLAAMRLARAALPYFRKSSCGRIICVGGTAAWIRPPRRHRFQAASEIRR